VVGPELPSPALRPRGPVTRPGRATMLPIDLARELQEATGEAPGLIGIDGRAVSAPEISG